MEDATVDVAVVGGGAGGVAAAVRARQLGAKTLVVEREHLGGVCMNRGCIPTKSLMETARLLRSIKRAGEFGLRVSGVEVDWETLMAKKDDVVQYLRLGTESVLKSNGVEIIRGDASFSGPNRLRVGDREFEARAVILATGSTWDLPGIQGIDQEGVINADDVLSMRELPPSVAVLGSGPVELELAQYLSFLGSRVILIEPEGRILPREDREVSRRLAGALREQGIEIRAPARVLEVKGDGAGLRIEVETREDSGPIRVDRVLHACRRPRLDGLEIEATGLSAAGGAIRVDECLRTAASGILAIGDVTGEPMTSYRASAMGVLGAENALGAKRVLDPSKLMRAYHTVPEVACIGLTEQEAKRGGHDPRVATIPYATNPKAMIMLETHGTVKVVADGRYGQILGVHLVGPHATELISEAALAMELEATVEDLAEAVRYHPSLAESQVDAARETMGRGIYLLR